MSSYGQSSIRTLLQVLQAHKDRRSFEEHIPGLTKCTSSASGESRCLYFSAGIGTPDHTVPGSSSARFCHTRLWAEARGSTWCMRLNCNRTRTGADGNAVETGLVQISAPTFGAHAAAPKLLLERFTRALNCMESSRRRWCGLMAAFPRIGSLRSQRLSDRLSCHSCTIGVRPNRGSPLSRTRELLANCWPFVCKSGLSAQTGRR